MIPVNEILKDKIKRTCENNGWCIDWDHLDESFNKIKGASSLPLICFSITKRQTKRNGSNRITQ